MDDYKADKAQWMTTKPTKRGLYWAVSQRHRDVLLVYWSAQCNLTAMFDELVELKDITHWMGPLVVPGKPDEAGKP
jgi:hypothetical protein